MGLFSFLKNMNGIKKSIKVQNELEKKALAMSCDELQNLSDNDLYTVLYARTEKSVERLELFEILEKLVGVKRVFYILDYFDMEVQNGGLCQFFVNSSRDLAPFVLGALKEIGATQYADLFNNFCTENQIDLSDLSSFIIKNIDEYKDQVARYPFDDFDNAYYNLYKTAPLNQFLIAFAKNNITEF